MRRSAPARVPAETEPGTTVVRTNCFECHSKCGVLAYVNRGRLVKVKGDPEDPRSRGVMCTKGQAAVQILYSPDRLNHCLMRTRPKGDPDPGWTRISYPEAMDRIHERIIRYRGEHGARSIAVGQGTGRGMNQWTMRLGNTIGQNHMISPGHICMGPMLSASLISLGGMPFLDGADAAHARCYVVWGANPLWTEAGIAASRFQQFKRNGGRLVVIDPFFLMPLSHKADLWLPLRPGSDSAMVMAWIQVILEERLFQAGFLTSWTNACDLVDLSHGFCVSEADFAGSGDPHARVVWDTSSRRVRRAGEPGVEPALFGSFDVEGRHLKTALQMLADQAAECPPERAEPLTWVQADKIRAAARMYAQNSPGSAIDAMQGIAETPSCLQTLRGLLVLMMLTANVDEKGGNVFHPFWREMVETRLTGRSSPDNERDRLADRRATLYPASQPKAFWDAILTGRPYPVRMLIQVAGNPVAYNENTPKVRRALEKLDFLVVRDYFMSPAARLADIVMPAAHWTERDYIADEVCGRWTYAQQKCVEPLFERKSDLSFLRDLGRRLDPEMWPWATDEELLDFQLEPLGITWEELKKKHCHEVAPEGYRRYASGEPAWRIQTPSGKFELYSTVLKTLGFDPVPRHREPLPPAAARAAGSGGRNYPLTLITGVRVPYFYNGTLHNIPWLRCMQSDPACFINRRTALELGLREREWVAVETPYGRTRARARLTEGIHPQVVVAQHGWWSGCRELKLGDYPGDEANVNNCVGDEPFGKETFTPFMRGLPCRVVPARSVGSDAGAEST
ncbi:MAG: molybdopterin-dependent oxidoreductase [bacterium]